MGLPLAWLATLRVWMNVFIPLCVGCRCKALAGLCLRTLRMELQLVVAYSLHGLALTSHLVEPEDEGHEVNI